MLSIMASSVSSERAFSSAGATISKLRNRLKADIVEALQFMKFSYRNDLLFRDPGPTSQSEIVQTEGVGEKESAWDELIDDDKDLNLNFIDQI